MEERKNRHYLHFKKLNPFNAYYMFVDVPAYYADALFIKYKVRVLFDGEYRKDGIPYIFVLCHVRKKNKDQFLKALDELPRKMMIMGYTDYEDFCEEFMRALDVPKDLSQPA